MAPREIWIIEEDIGNGWEPGLGIYLSENTMRSGLSLLKEFAKREALDPGEKKARYRAAPGPYILVLPDATKPKKRVAKKRKAVRK